MASGINTGVEKYAMRRGMYSYLYHKI